jgi:hypothetical protein
VELVLTATENIRCVAVSAGTTPSGRQVYEGKGHTDATVPTSVVLLARVDAVTRVLITGLEQGKTLDGYCATASYGMSRRFPVQTLAAQFSVELTQKEAATDTTFALEFALNAAETVRCALVDPNERPTAKEIMVGQTAGGRPAVTTSSGTNAQVLSSSLSSLKSFFSQFLLLRHFFFLFLSNISYMVVLFHRLAS